MLPFLFLLAAAQAPSATADQSDRAVAEQAAASAKLNCDQHKFEKIVTAMVDGAPKSSRLRLCGTDGQSDADWIRTLEDSSSKLKETKSLSEDMRLAMIDALDQEVARLKIALAFAEKNNMGAKTDISTGTSGGGDFTLKPREPVKVGGGTMQDYNMLPPLPVAKPGEKVAAVAAEPARFARPDVRFQCFGDSDMAEGPCDYLDRYSTIVLQTRSATTEGTALQFIVDGDEREEIDIGGMRKGQRRRIAVSSQVCRGVSSARLELAVMVMPEQVKLGPQRASTAGPFILKCQ